MSNSPKITEQVQIPGIGIGHLLCSMYAKCIHTDLIYLGIHVVSLPHR